jgi:hypothetical protein
MGGEHGGRVGAVVLLLEWLVAGAAVARWPRAHVVSASSPGEDHDHAWRTVELT